MAAAFFGAAFFTTAFFTAGFLAAAFFGAAFFTAAFLGAAFFTTAFFAAGFLAAAFFGAAFFTAFFTAGFLAAAFLGAAFLGAAFLAAGFLGAAFFAGFGASAGGGRRGVSAMGGSFTPFWAGLEGVVREDGLPLASFAPGWTGSFRGVDMRSLAAGTAVGACAASAAEPVLPLGFAAFFGGSTPARIWARRLPG